MQERCPGNLQEDTAEEATFQTGAGRWGLPEGEDVRGEGRALRNYLTVGKEAFSGIWWDTRRYNQLFKKKNKQLKKIEANMNIRKNKKLYEKGQVIKYGAWHKSGQY